MDKKIKPIEYIGENYDDVSDYCNTHQKPMFFTQNGQVDLVAMSIKAFEKLCGRHDAFISDLKGDSNV